MSSALKVISNGRILPPRKILIPVLSIFASSFLNVAPVKIVQIDLRRHQDHPSGTSNGISSVISTTLSLICS